METRHLAAWGAALLLSVHAPARPASEPDRAKDPVAAFRTWADQFDKELAKLKSGAPSQQAVDEQCTAAREAESRMREPTTDASVSRQRVERARRERQACDDLQSSQSAGAQGLARMLAIEREVNVRLGRCLERRSGPESAIYCGASMQALDSVWKPEPGKEGTAKPEATVVEAAAAAQKQVDKLRDAFKDAYKRADAAKGSVMALTDLNSLGSGVTREQIRQKVDLWAGYARTKAEEFDITKRLAQFDVNDLSNAVIRRGQCLADRDAACVEETTVQALVARASFDLHVARAKAADEALSEASLGLSVVKERPDIQKDELVRAMAFRRLLDDNPDVQSFFGGDAVGLNISASEQSISFRIVKDFGSGGLLGRQSRLTWVFSAPTNPNGRADFATSADALKNTTSVKLSWQLTNQPFELQTFSTLHDFAFGIGAGRKSHTYFLVDDAKGGVPAETKSNRTTFKAGVRWALLNRPASDYKTLLVLAYDRQRNYTDGDTETRCPGVAPTLASARAAASAPSIPLVPCYTGSWGVPERADTDLLGLELRQHTPFVDVGLKVKQDRKTHKVDVDLPIYLIRSLPGDSKDKTFNAGISLSRSTGDQGLKWGLFVSAPLSFGSPERP